ncbi:MAG: 30S ribosomal protein S4 [Deltaproteobacteria bacterium]|nr:30S ribosomal protein S4 [Deltaproteobacteria bacterium]
MARYKDSVCKMCRREGMKLFLKGDRCYSDKCAVERREYPPGQHGKGKRSKFSEYGSQLREKQKIRRIYGVLEAQFRKIFAEADRRRGVTGENLIQLLESRLDNMVYRMGFANSRSEARLLVGQRHFKVNGKTVTIPSYFTRSGDKVAVADKSQKLTRIEAARQAGQRRGLPEWLELDSTGFVGTIKMLPVRNQITMPMNEHLVVELYSK